MLIAETEVVTIAASGTPVRCTLTEKCCAFRAKNPNGAAGVAEVGLAGLTRATGVKVIDDMLPGEPFELGRQTQGNTIDPRDYWFDAANSAQKIYVTTWRHV